ncbi:MAG: lactate utilization protein B [Candidatus Korarchaeota archaeon]|nr:lactate utilization protein B [Candidatus Korarchaeota archaeon]
MTDLTGVSQLLNKVSDDPVLRTALDRAISSYWKKRKQVMERYPYVKELADEVRRIKEWSIDHMDELLDKAIEAVEAKGGKAYIAETAEEARKIVGELVGTGKVVTKAKSMTTEELKLREFLIERGNEVYETDLGEFLVQFLGPKPMHFISPSIHLTREKVAEFLKDFMGVEVDKDDVEGMVALVRKFLRDKYFSADVGISGANAFAADRGAVFLIENESNIRLSISLPPKHIAVVGMEKIVPTMSDAWKVVEVISRYGGYKVTSYINTVMGPARSGEGDIGPEEYHVIFLDNGRREASKDPILKQTLYCLRCGACQYLCPVFGIVGGYWAGLESAYSGGIGVMWEYITGDKETSTQHAFACLLCGRCIEACPMRINQPEVLREIRRRLMERI